MPKIANKRHRLITAPYPELKAAEEGLESHLSRGQRKRQVKKMQVMRKTGKAETGLKTSAPTEPTAVLRLDDISAALSSLPEMLDEPEQVRQGREQVVKSNKMKHKTAVKEAEHLKLVLQHPAYQSDPLATIRTHLENTIGKQQQQHQR